jgi:cytochrome c-type biogenesis protein CcmH
MTTFILIAIVLTIAAVGVVVVPLVRKSGATPTPAIWAAFAATGLLVFGGGGLYLVWSNWNWKQADAAGDAVTPQNMVSRLARRLEKNPNDLDGWLRLGHSYTVLEQYPLAMRAYQKANELGGGKNVDALLGLGESLVLNDDNELTGRGGKYIEQVLKLDPKNGKALFYGAVAAVRRGELPLARERFSALLTLDPPPADNVRAIFEQQIQAIDAQLAQQSGAGGSAPGGNGAEGRTAGSPGAAVAGKADSSTAGGNPAAAGAVPPVRVHVTLAANLKADALSSLPLFVFVRDPRAAGPPLAVKRLKATFPQTVELTTQDSMLPGHSFTKGQLVEIVARVSKSGGPVEASGDLFGLAAHKVGEGGVVDIQVEHVSP